MELKSVRWLKVKLMIKKKWNKVLLTIHVRVQSPTAFKSNITVELRQYYTHDISFQLI